MVYITNEFMLFYITKCGSQTIVNNVCKNSNLTRLSIPNNIKADETYKLYDKSNTNRPYFISDFIDKYKNSFFIYYNQKSI